MTLGSDDRCTCPSWSQSRRLTGWLLLLPNHHFSSCCDKLQTTKKKRISVLSQLAIATKNEKNGGFWFLSLLRQKTNWRIANFVAMGLLRQKTKKLTGLLILSQWGCCDKFKTTLEGIHIRGGRAWKLFLQQTFWRFFMGTSGVFQLQLWMILCGEKFLNVHKKSTKSPDKVQKKSTDVTTSTE